MSVTLDKSGKDGFTLKLSFRYNKSMLEGEEQILDVLNKAGTMATKEFAETFDTDGSPIQKGNQTFTSKGQYEKNYQTPYGSTRVVRHVYQSHSGGKTYCPLEDGARMVLTSTPRFAKMVSSKYSQMAVTAVKKDLGENHGRGVQKKLIQNVSEAVGGVILAKEDQWEYEIPPLKDKVEGISIGLDGTCLLMKEDGWREAMVGTVSLYNKRGEKMHTGYVAAPPEYGKEKFMGKLEKEIAKTKKSFPKAFCLGLADGAKDNWSFLEKHTDDQLLDFYHASEYVGSVGKVLSPSPDDWIEKKCHGLKHHRGGAARLLAEFKEYGKSVKKLSDKKTVEKAATYFGNNKGRMRYHEYLDSVLPIGSGATEAACKVIVKQRMCQSGMRWKQEGAQIVLATRSLHETAGRWSQFWKKVDRYGFNF